MKCDDCFYNSYHCGGSWQGVANGGDDPYSYDYCAKGHWGGEPPEITDHTEVVEGKDHFENCLDYKPVVSSYPTL